MRIICLLLFIAISLFSSAKSYFEHTSAKEIQYCHTKILSENYQGETRLEPYYQITFQASHLPIDDSLAKEKIKRKARWSKWLGIGSLVGLIIPGINLLSLPAAIAAIVISHQIPKESKAYEDASTGKKTGWFTIGFLIVIAVVVFIVTLPLGPR